MAKVLVVTSGKGGVGKTTTTAAMGAALAQNGQKVVVVDFDVGLRNLDLVMGAERRVVFDLINVVQGVAKLSQAPVIFGVHHPHASDALDRLKDDRSHGGRRTKIVHHLFESVEVGVKTEDADGCDEE